MLYVKAELPCRRFMKPAGWRGGICAAPVRSYSHHVAPHGRPGDAAAVNRGVRRVRHLARMGAVTTKPSLKRVTSSSLRSCRPLGLGVSALFVLGACSSSDREFDNKNTDAGSSGGTAGSGATGGAAAGSGGTAGSGGSAGSTTGGAGGVAGSATGGAGGAGGAACTTSDPDCECVGGKVQAKDADGDGQGSIDCAEAPGTDCDDNDKNYQVNACGGCAKLAGVPNQLCGQCGTWACDGKEKLKCSVAGPALKRCNSATIELCVNGNWVPQSQCTGTTPACLVDKCVQCTPGAFKCSAYGTQGDTVGFKCLTSGSWESSWSVSCLKSKGVTCNVATKSCTSLLLPQDHSFEILDPSIKRLEDRLGEGLRPTRDVLDLASGFEFA